jgi:hypothetical protein
MTAEGAIKLDMAKFIAWTKTAKQKELKRVCAVSTHSQHWEVVRLELGERDQNVLILLFVSALLLLAILLR